MSSMYYLIMQTLDEKPDPIESEDQPSDHRYRMRFQWNDLMEDLIEDGRRRGLFDDLQGKGKPLDLDVNIFEGDRALANKLLKSNDILPPWLSSRIGVSTKIEDLRAEMEQTWERYRAGLVQSPGEAHRQSLKLGWDETCKRWDSFIENLNKEIESYNLKRPPGQPEVYKVRLIDELKRISAPRHLF